MLKLVFLAVVVGCAIAHPGLFDGVSSALNTFTGSAGQVLNHATSGVSNTFDTLTGSAGQVLNHATSGVGNAVTGIFGFGGDVMHVSVEQLQSYFKNILGIQKVGVSVGVDYCTCPYFIYGANYQAGLNVQTGGGFH